MNTTKRDPLDAEIQRAWQDVKTARARWSRSPNADTILAEQRAQQRLDNLLDRRLGRA